LVLSGQLLMGNHSFLNALATPIAAYRSQLGLTNVRDTDHVVQSPG
jgi:hypothetical protein